MWRQYVSSEWEKSKVVLKWDCRALLNQRNNESIGCLLNYGNNLVIFFKRVSKTIFFFLSILNLSEKSLTLAPSLSKRTMGVLRDLKNSISLRCRWDGRLFGDCPLEKRTTFHAFRELFLLPFFGASLWKSLKENEIFLELSYFTCPEISHDMDGLVSWISGTYLKFSLN